MEKRYEFNMPSRLEAYAVGQAGKRTFFLAIAEKDQWLRIWLEKYLLESLGQAIDQFLQTLAKEKIDIEFGEWDMPAERPTRMPAEELDVEQIGLGVESGLATLSIMAHRAGARHNEEVELHCRITKRQLEKLSEKAKEVCAAGRPICATCGYPIDPSGHTCTANN